MRTSEDAHADPWVGVVLDGRYRLVERIARGGMATVYRAHDQRLERTVAVKVMHPAFADDESFVARFTREARSAARLSAPEVVAVYDQGHDEHEGLVYLVMEHVRGRDLRALMRERGPLAPDRALSLIEPVLAALAAAHAAGIVHRDVKPENVLLGDDGRVKVADFGLARAVEASSVTATTGMILGTAAYLAPEQIEHGTADPRTDVYAVGIVLWEMLVGRAPVTGETPVAVLFQHVNKDVPPPSTQIGGISPAVDDLVIRATRRDAGRRPQDAAAFLSEVRAMRGELTGVLPASVPGPDQTTRFPRQQTLVVPTQTERPPVRESSTIALPPRRPDGPPATKRRRRRRGLIALVAVLLLGLLAGVGGWWFSSGRYTSAPSVEHMNQTDAERTLKEAGFSVRFGTPAFDNEGEFAQGEVKDQDPDPNGKVLRNGTITLVVSKGLDLKRVPRLSGLTRARADAALRAVDLSVGTPSSSYSDTVPAGSVISSNPDAGASLLVGKPVSYTLSRGVEPVQVPSGLVGLQRDEAQRLVEAVGLTVSATEQFDETVPAGQVMSARPSTGTAPKGSAVRLVVSKGPEPRTIPDVIGMSGGRAREVLEGEGLQVQIVSLFGFGQVRQVDPGVGTQVERGSTVRLGVY